MRKNKRNFVRFFLILLLLIVISIGWKLLSPNTRDIAEWKEQGVLCLAKDGDSAKGNNPVLQILADGIPEIIPDDIGETKKCRAELSTQDISGTIYINAETPEKRFTLGQFFSVWGEPFEREGYDIQMTVNGRLNTELENLTLREKQLIIIEYERR